MENSLDCSVMCTCRIGAGIGAEESCKTSSCRIAVLEVSVKTVMPLERARNPVLNDVTGIAVLRRPDLVSPRSGSRIH